LLGLAGEVGELLTEYKKHLRDGAAHQLFSTRITEELGDILWYVAAVGSYYGLELETIAAENLAKCDANWGRDLLGRSVAGRFDSAFPERERFPEKFRIHFEEIVEGDIVRIRASWDGVQMGQTLTDNAYEDDGYRFHDVFHLGCAACLGWSPVTRRNLSLKRKSNKEVDEVEDGGRAIVIEEGVTALVFGYAIEHNWLDAVSRIDHDLLKVIKRMTAHLEVSQCTVAEWEAAILKSYPVWRQVISQRGGFVELDLRNRSITFVNEVQQAEERREQTV